MTSELSKRSARSGHSDAGNREAKWRTQAFWLEDRVFVIETTRVLSNSPGGMQAQRSRPAGPTQHPIVELSTKPHAAWYNPLSHHSCGRQDEPSAAPQR